MPIYEAQVHNGYEAIFQLGTVELKYIPKPPETIYFDVPDDVSDEQALIEFKDIFSRKILSIKRIKRKDMYPKVPIIIKETFPYVPNT